MPEDPRPGHSDREVLRLAAPVGLAFIPLGMALGLLIVHAGLAWWWAPVAAAVMTTFIVNSRHIFYALSFPWHWVAGIAGKAYSTYVLSDEAYAVAVSAEARDWGSRQILLMQFAFHLIWTVSSALGGLIGGALPIERLRGLDVAAHDATVWGPRCA